MQKDMTVNGDICGNCTAHGSVIITDGDICGACSADNVTINNGDVNGACIARDKIILSD